MKDMHAAWAFQPALGSILAVEHATEGGRVGAPATAAASQDASSDALSQAPWLAQPIQLRTCSDAQWNKEVHGQLHFLMLNCVGDAATMAAAWLRAVGHR